MGSIRASTTAMAKPCGAIQGLVRTCAPVQQMIREWADSQGVQNREFRACSSGWRASTRRMRRMGVGMALSRARRSGAFNYWPGFVDALSTLVIAWCCLSVVFW